MRRTAHATLFAVALITSLPAEAQSQEGWTRSATGALGSEDSFDSPPPAFEFERPPSIIEAIEIIGNEKTDDDVIEDRLLLKVGDLLDDALIEESRLRLLGTGYFRSVEFSLKRGSRRGLIVLVIDLEERTTVTLDGLYLGYSKVTPIFGGLGILERNFLGKGVTTGAGFALGKDRRAFDLHVFVPKLSNTPLQLSASGILVQSGREVLDEENPEGPSLAYSRYGGTLGFGLGVGSAQRVALDYRLESIQVDRLANLDPPLIRAAPSILFDESILSTLSVTYERDTRDDPFVPYSGHRVELSVETGTTLLGSSYEFTKYTGYGQIALPGFADHAASVRIFGGLIQGETPFFNQFWLSDHAYFAFGRDSLPRAIQVNFSESNDYDDLLISVGGDYSIPIQSGGDWLYRTYLYAGIDLSASASLDEVQEDPTGRGTGARFPLSADLGLRLDTDIGRLTLSLAYIAELVF